MRLRRPVANKCSDARRAPAFRQQDSSTQSRRCQPDRVAPRRRRCRQRLKPHCRRPASSRCSVLSAGERQCRWSPQCWPSRCSDSSASAASEVRPPPTARPPPHSPSRRRRSRCFHLMAAAEALSPHSPRRRRHRHSAQPCRTKRPIEGLPTSNIIRMYNIQAYLIWPLTYEYTKFKKSCGQRLNTD